MILLRVLNDCSISTANARITPGAKLLFSLAFYLVLERGKFIPRDVLTSLFWPDASPRSARHSLRRALWQLRRDGFPLANDHDLQVFLPKDAATLDIDAFINTTEETQLTQPIHLLPWIPTLGSAQFRDWVDDIRYIIHTRFTLRLNAAASQAKNRGDWKAVLRFAERTLELDPDCSIARANAAQARQALRSHSHPHKRPQLLFPAYAPLRAITLLGESLPPSYQHAHGATTIQTNDVTQEVTQDETEDTTEDATPGKRHSKTHDETYNGTYSETHGETHPAQSDNSNLALLQALLNNACNNVGTSLHIHSNDSEHTTSLIEALSSIATTQGAITITTTLSDHHTLTPFSALSAMIPALQNAPGAAGCDPTFTQHLSQLLHLQTTTELDSPESLSSISFDEVHSTILPALTDLISAVAEEQPLLLVINDIHCADTGSLALLTTLASHITKHAVFLLFTSHDQTARPQPVNRLLQLCTELERTLTNAVTSITLRYDKTATMLTTLRDVKASLHPTTPHDDLELLTLATLRHTERHWLPIANCAYECISATHATPHHRLEAGTLLCTLAAALGDATLIRNTQQALHALTTQPDDALVIPQLKFQALSHGLTGSSTIAIDAARSLLTLTRQTQRPPDLLNTLLIAGNTLHSCGIPESASGIYLEMFSRATRDKWLPYATLSSLELTRLSLDLGNLSEARTWCDRMMSFATSTDSLWEQSSILLLQLRVALALKDIALATQLLTPTLPLLSAPLLSVQASARASQLRLLMLQETPKATVQQKAEELLALSHKLRTLRIFHYEFFSLYLAFTFIGNEEMGTQILHDYMEAPQTASVKD